MPSKRIEKFAIRRSADMRLAEDKRLAKRHDQMMRRVPRTHLSSGPSNRPDRPGSSAPAAAPTGAGTTRRPQQHDDG
jgi:hypothetical protein